MQVKMINYLYPFFANVKQKLISSQALVLGNFFGRIYKLGNYVVMVVLKVGNGLDMNLGNHQKMHRSLWMNIFENLNIAVFVDNFRGNFVFRDSTEKTIHVSIALASFLKILSAFPEE